MKKPIEPTIKKDIKIIKYYNYIDLKKVIEEFVGYKDVFISIVDEYELKVEGSRQIETEEEFKIRKREYYKEKKLYNKWFKENGKKLETEKQDLLKRINDIDEELGGKK